MLTFLPRRAVLVLGASAVALLAPGCDLGFIQVLEPPPRPDATSTAASSQPAAEAPAAKAPAPAVAKKSSAAPASKPAAPAENSSSGIRLELVPDESEARYRVREQLAGNDLPSDAIGRTSELSGSIMLADSGAVVAAESKIVIDMATFTSDDSRRDNFTRRTTLAVRQFPTADFVLTGLTGLDFPLPTSGSVEFTLAGEMTLHGVMQEVEWAASATFTPDSFSGTATMPFTFTQYGMEPPRAPILLSVDDNGVMELDFTFTVVD